MSLGRVGGARLLPICQKGGMVLECKVPSLYHWSHIGFEASSGLATSWVTRTDQPCQARLFGKSWTSGKQKVGSSENCAPC